MRELPPIAVVVPTYWAHPRSQERYSEAVYDHPTPLNEEGTLGRLLESLSRLDTSSFYVVIVVAVTELSAQAQARAKVRSIAQQYPGLTTLFVASEECDRLTQAVSDPLLKDLIGLAGYARVRNLHLAVPLILDAEMIVALDDDEIVTDVEFLDKATRHIGSLIDGQGVEGLGGYYLQNEEGEVLLEVSRGVAAEPNLFDRKAAIMNEATENLEQLPARIVPTPFCFGGNMTFSRKLASEVAFDPNITRGEDIDYLINARLAGHTYFMYKDLKILHCPPSGASYMDVAYHKVVQDVLRFAYEREKIRHSAELGGGVELTPADFDPYPGFFLTEQLDNDAREVIDRIIQQTSPSQREQLGIGDDPDAVLNHAKERAARGVEMYCTYQDAWRESIQQLRSDESVKAWLLGRVNPDMSMSAGV